MYMYVNKRGNSAVENLCIDVLLLFVRMLPNLIIIVYSSQKVKRLRKVQGVNSFIYPPYKIRQRIQKVDNELPDH